jgi:thiol-disulfide isomerase/thioredoxin
MSLRLFCILVTVLPLLGCSEPAPPPSGSVASSGAPSTSEAATPPVAAPATAPVPGQNGDLMTQVQAALQASDFDKALQLADQALAADSQNPQTIMLFAQLAQARGAELVASDRKAANAIFLRCAEAMRTYEKLRPSLGARERQLLANALYNEACVFATENQADKAMGSLKAALAAGFADVETLTRDSDLSSLRENPQFQQMVQEAIAAAQKLAREEAEAQLAKHQPFPFAFSLPTVDGKPVALSDLKGKVVIVDIWGTWCPPCRMEIPHFVELYKKHKEAGLEIVGINYEQVPDEEVKTTIADFIRDQGVNYACVIGDDATREQVPDFEGFPTTLFIDRGGVVRLKVVGYHPYDKLEAIVLALLSEPAKET